MPMTLMSYPQRRANAWTYPVLVQIAAKSTNISCSDRKTSSFC